MIDLFKKFRRPSQTDAVPASSSAPAGVPTTVVVAAPIAGRVIALDDVPDPVFAGRMLGDGRAIDPSEDTLFAPFDGVVAALAATRHAVTLRAANGAEVLMHVGVDTVGLKGTGFTAHVAEGAKVRRGDRLISFDRALVAPRVPSLVVPILLIGGDGLAVLPAASRTGDIARGDALFEIGPLPSAASAAAPTAAADTDAAIEFRCEVEIGDPFGIHARPAGLIAELAKGSKSEIVVQLGDRSANARSPVALMLLGAQRGDVVNISAEGADAETCARAIALLIGGAESAPAIEVAPEGDRGDAAPEMLADGAPLEITGVTASPGKAVGLSYRIVREDLVVVEAGTGVEREAAALQFCLQQTRTSLQSTIASAEAGQQAEILAAHLSFLEDPDLQNAAEALIREGKSAAFAWKSVIDRQITALRRLGNPVLAERASDLEDIERRVLAALLGKGERALVLPERAVVFADDLLPYEFVELDATKLAAICLARGGPTAHVAILAASRGLPTIVACGSDVLRVPDGQTVVIDADKGLARINPPAAEIERFRKAAAQRQEHAAACLAAAREICRTADGTRIEVVANLGSPNDVASAVLNGAEGCGLFRSEFLFLDRRSAPTEEEQFIQYQATATALEGRPLIIRTLDAGADKDVPYAELPRDENPALGLRGVRMSLWRPQLLHTQIRAILRVQPYGQCRILLPMIATLDDLRDVRRVIDEEMASLGRTSPIEVGIMVEVPSVALCAERFAREADFFSVGTNDLTQYTLAMDRVNPRLARQLDPFHPSVLRLVSLAAEGARAHDRWIGVCGSLASFPIAAPLLIGLGVTELSVTTGAIAEVKAFVHTLDMDRCREIAARALTAESGDEVRRMLMETWPSP